MSIESGDESGHPPNVRRVSYSGRALRFLELPERELLLNTKDVCALAGIPDRSGRPLLHYACLNLAGAVWVATDVNPDFAQWLILFFRDKRSLTKPALPCDDEWTSLE